MRKCATRAVSRSVLVCIVLTSGAMFGMAAQSTLHHLGLDLGSVHRDFVVGWAAQSRSALAWWAWWLVLVAAVFVGPLSVAVTRFLAGHWWLWRGLQLVVAAAVVLGLAAIGHLHPAPLQLGASAGTGLGLVVVASCALLAVLGAVTMRRAPRPVRLPVMAGGRYRVVSLVAAPLAPRGGGSVDSGFPMRRFWFGHTLVPGSRRPQVVAKLGRWAVAASLAVTAFAAASAVGAGTVLFELFAPAAIHRVVAWYPVPPEPPLVSLARVETTAPAPGPLRHSLADTLDAGLRIVAPLSESDLTFSKGYPKRRAAREAAGFMVASVKTEIPSQLVPRRYAAALRLAASYRRQSHDGRTRYAQDHGRRSHDRHVHRTVQRYARNDHDGRWYDNARRDTSDRERRTGYNRHRGHDRGRGFDRFARYDGYRGF